MCIMYLETYPIIKKYMDRERNDDEKKVSFKGYQLLLKTETAFKGDATVKYSPISESDKFFHQYIIGEWYIDKNEDHIFSCVWGQKSFYYPPGYHILLTLKDARKLRKYIAQDREYCQISRKLSVVIMQLKFRKILASGPVGWIYRGEDENGNPRLITRCVVAREKCFLKEVI